MSSSQRFLVRLPPRFGAYSFFFAQKDRRLLTAFPVSMPLNYFLNIQRILCVHQRNILQQLLNSSTVATFFCNQQEQNVLFAYINRRFSVSRQIMLPPKCTRGRVITSSLLYRLATLSEVSRSPSFTGVPLLANNHTSLSSPGTCIPDSSHLPA